MTYQGQNLKEAPKDEEHSVHHFCGWFERLVRLGRVLEVRSQLDYDAQRSSLMCDGYEAAERVVACFAVVLRRLGIAVVQDKYAEK